MKITPNVIYIYAHSILKFQPKSFAIKNKIHTNILSIDHIDIMLLIRVLNLPQVLMPRTSKKERYVK